MFDNPYRSSELSPNTSRDNYVNIVKAENGFSVSTNGGLRIYSDLDSAFADLKEYFK